MTSSPETQGGAGVPDGWQRLWKPERMAYIQGEGKGEPQQAYATSLGLWMPAEPKSAK